MIAILYHNGTIKNAINRVIKNKVSRFAVVGLFNTITDLIILNTLRVLTHTTSNQTARLIILNIISASTVAGISFYLNRKFVFKAYEVKNEMFIPFLLVTLTSIFILQSAVISIALHVFDPLSNALFNLGSSLPIIKNFSFNFYETNLAKICATAASMTWNYVWYNKIIFKTRTNDFS